MKVNFFWNFFVFFIFLYYFNELNKKRKVSVHSSYTQKLSENPSILFCVSLFKNCENKNKKIGDFKNTNSKKKTMEDFICHINKNIPNNPKLIIEEAEKWNFYNAFENLSKNSNEKNIILYDYHLCANFDLILNLSQSVHHFEFSVNYIVTKVFLYPASKFEMFLGEELITFNDNENKKYISSLYIKQVKFLKSNDGKTCLAKNKILQSYKCSKVFCFQYCFKKKINSHRFLYIKDDDIFLKVNNESSNPVDQKCFEKCHKSFYGYFYYIKEIKFKKKKNNNVKFIFDSSVRKIFPENLLTNEFFFLEIMSLLSVLLSFNYLDFLNRFFFEFLKILKIKKSFLIKKIKVFVLMFVNICLILNCFKMSSTYKNFLFINTTTSFLPIENKPFSFSPCFDVNTIIDKKKNNSLVDLVEPIEKNTIFSIEAYTLNFEKLINKSEIRFIENYEKINLKKNQISIFYTSDWLSNNNTLTIYKCFFISINISQRLIENLLKNSAIVFQFNKMVSFYYLTDHNFYPNSLTDKMYYNAEYKVFKKVSKGDKKIFNCKKYEKICRSQRECIDRCFVNTYLKKFFKLPPNVPILSKWYKKKWINFLSFHLNKLENSTEYNSLMKFCLDFFPLEDCYSKNYKIVNLLFKNQTSLVKIFLKEYVELDIKIVCFNKYELIFNIITSINVWVGLSIPKLLQNLIFQINKIFFLKFNLAEKKNLFKSLKFLSNLIVFLCLIYSLYLLIEQISKQSKITSVKYKFLTNIQYPYITICLDYKEKFEIKKNFNLSGNLLDKLTFSANDVFKSISYLDNDLNLNNQTEFNMLELNKNHRILKLSHFYFYNFKCYKLKYNINIPYYKYLRKKDNLDFLTINFNEDLKKYYLLLESKGHINYRQIMKLSNHNNIVYFFKITIQFEDFYTFLRDPFYFFKGKQLVNFNEGVSYYKFIRKKFKELRNKSTLMLPLSKKFFDLAINDKEYLEFYETEMVKLEKQNFDKNFKKVYFQSIIFQSKIYISNQLKIKPKFLTSETLITDKIHVHHFILNVLNILSFWLNLSLVNFLDQLKSFLRFKKNLFSCLFFLFFFKIKRFIHKNLSL